MLGELKIEPNVNLHAKRKTIFTKTFAFILLILIILLFIWISFLPFQPPQFLTSKQAGEDQFSAERARDYLKEIAVKPHPLGSEEHDRVRDYLFNTLTDLGVSPEIQVTEVKTPLWENGYVGKLENIVARIPGKDSSMAIMISAHYDSVENSPGASDNGSGVAAILETVDILSRSAQLKNDVIILLTDGEEHGLLGARAFVNSHPWAKDVALIFNFDTRGNTGPSIMFQINEGNERLISEFIKAVPHPVTHSFISELYTYMPNDTDFTIFNQAGMYGLNFGLVKGLSSYHTSLDTVENMDLDSLQHTGDNMLHVVQHLGNMNLVPEKDGNKVFFNLIGNVVITYPENLALPFMIIGIITYLLSFVHGFKLKQLTIGGTSIGVFLFVSVMIIAFYMGEGIWNLIVQYFPENVWSLETNLNESNPIFISSIFVLISIMIVLYQLAAKKIQPYDLTMGAYFCWLLLTIVTSIFYKESSYIFIWPLLAGLLGMNILMRLKNEYSISGYVITLAFTLPGVLIAVPALYLIYIAFTLKIIHVLLPLTTLLAAFIIPILSTFKFRSIFVFPIILVTIGVSIVAISAVFY